jgi:hypothetical protein
LESDACGTPSCRGHLGRRRQGIGWSVVVIGTIAGGLERPTATVRYPRQTEPNQARRPAYSATTSPEPPNSAGKSFNFGSPSRMGKTVSA